MEAEALRIVFRAPQWPASTLGEGEAGCGGECSEADAK